MGNEQRTKRTIHNGEDFAELYRRAESLTVHHTPKWGSMNISQMLEHASRSITVGLGTFTPPSEATWFTRTVIKRFALRMELPKNSPTAKAFKITEEPEFNNGKAALLSNLKAAQAKGMTGKWSNHVSFGPLTPAEWGVLIFKHISHHLSQFGA